jgi:hypothetical protein
LDTVLILENKTSTENFFLVVNSYRTLNKILQNYYNAHKEKFAGVPFEEVRLTFDDCIDILDYWLKTDHEVRLLEERELLSPAEQIKLAIGETIFKYENIIQNTESEVERVVLQSTIDTLKKKITQLENGVITEMGDTTNRTDVVDKKKEEKRMKILQELFYFYSKQQLGVGKSSTFDKIEHKSNTLNLGQFLFIIKTFFLEHTPSEYVNSEDKEVKKQFLEEQKEFKKKVDRQVSSAVYRL